MGNVMKIDEITQEELDTWSEQKTMVIKDIAELEEELPHGC